jgi:hypothetical protein
MCKKKMVGPILLSVFQFMQNEEDDIAMLHNALHSSNECDDMIIAAAVTVAGVNPWP